ncbi:hypothetical protein C8039_07990 [Halogeometricum sp. wsp3]|nr:hypothetical protein C8039_07990 [Halogeometricum sp. wsp3]
MDGKPHSEHVVTRLLTGVSGVWVRCSVSWLVASYAFKQSAPILGDDGTVERVVVVPNDASSLKQREEQLEWLVGTETLADAGGWELDLETGLIDEAGGTPYERRDNPTLEDGYQTVPSQR